MNDEIKKGQAFIGRDGNKYYYLGLDYNNQICFTTLDWWKEDEPKYQTDNPLFISEILDEISFTISDCTWYYQSMKELENATMKDKMKRCLDIIRNANNEHIELRTKEFGPLVRGQAYSEEYGHYYEVIGFIVDNDIYVDSNLKDRQKGLFAIYHSNCESTVPLIFERAEKKEDNSFNGKHFIAGNNDKVYVTDIIYDMDEVNELLDEKQKQDDMLR